MKIEGHELNAPSVEYVVIPRGINPETGKRHPDIIFQCKPVISYEGFDQRCPLPKPPEAIKAGGRRVQNLDDPAFIAQTKQYSDYRISYLIIKSLEATPGLQWETIDMKNPATWKNYQTELQAAGFNQFEINKIVEGCLSANSLNQKRMDEALANFLHGQGAA